MTVAGFFRKYSVGCILDYVRLIITREISCIYIQLLLQLCTEVSQATTQRKVDSSCKKPIWICNSNFMALFV
jgi:hypothetical protein